MYGDLSYQWYHEYKYEEYGSIYWDDEKINGATDVTYITNPITKPENYYCCVRDIYGNEENVWFYVSIDNGFEVMPACSTTRYVEPETDVELAVSATCNTGELTYEWHKAYRYENGYGDWWYEYYDAVIGDARSYTVANISERGAYCCDVTDQYGNSKRVEFYIYIENELTAYAKDYQNSFTVEPGETVTMEVEASCTSGILTYQWYRYCRFEEDGENYWETVEIDGATDADYTTGPMTESEEYKCVIEDEYGNSTDLWFSIHINNELTARALNGEDSLLVHYGDTIALTVDANCSEGELTYQWYYRYYYEEDGENYSRDEEIDGAVNETYVIDSITKVGEYLCRVSDIYGNSTYVWFGIQIDNEMTAKQLDGESSIYVAPRETVALTVEASCANGELTYQWYHRYQYEEDGEIYWGEEIVSDETDETCVTDPITQYEEQYYCRVSDIYGNTESVWFYIYIVNDLTVTPVGSRTKNVEAGTDVELAVVADCNDGVLFYEWYEAIRYEGDNGNGWYEYNDTVIGDTSSFIIQNISHNGRYRCIVRDQYESSQSIEYYVYVNNELEIIRTISDNPVPVGEQAVLQVQASCKNGGMTYKWYKYICEEENGVTNEGWQTIPGATDAVYTTEAVTEMRTQYKCTVTDDYGNSSNAWFTVNADTELTAVPAGRNVFNVTEAPITLAVNASNLFENSEMGISYQWYDSDYNEIYGATEPSYTLMNPETGIYRCVVSDGNQYKYVWFYITEEPFARAYGDQTYWDVEPGEEVTLQVAAWNAADDIEYQWYVAQHYGGEGTLIEGATNPSYTFIMDSDRSYPYCHVSGTGLDRDIWFVVRIENNLEIDYTGLSRIQVIPADGSIQLTANVISKWDDALTYRWYRNGTMLEGSGDTLTVTEGGGYTFYANDRFGNSTEATFYCVSDEPETVNEGVKVTGPEDGGVLIYQFIPARTGTYQMEAEGWCAIYRPNRWYEDTNLGNETREIQLNGGQIYYVVLDSSEDSFKYTMLHEEQAEYTIILQKGLSLRIPELYSGGSWYSIDYTSSSNRNVIRVDGNWMDVRAEGSADVTVAYYGDKQCVYHITVVTGNTMTLPEGLETIEANAFNGDTSIRFIRLGSNIQTVESGAFANVGDINVIVDGYETSLEEGVFTNSNPLIIIYDGGNVSWYCRNHNIPYFYGER